MPFEPQSRPSPWPHRLAVALALVTFPLIWVGGLVTTYDAGMAVPDWPGTYGYNLLRYPWQTWFAAPWDLFIEHGHRLLGATAGFLAIALVAVVALTDRRGWLLAAAIGALVLVVFQGLLGGARVLFDARVVAMLHGCIGPLFFAYLAGLIVVTSKWWQSAPNVQSQSGQRLVRAAWITAAIVYLQLVLGAIVRHVPLAAAPAVFRAALICHLVLAIALAGHVIMLAIRATSLPREVNGLRGFVWLSFALVMAQMVLGVATYIAKYAFPAWLGDYAFAANYVVHEKSLFQSLITTAHVANGSLILFFGVILAVRATIVFQHANAVLSPRVIAGHTDSHVLHAEYLVLSTQHSDCVASAATSRSSLVPTRPVPAQSW